MRLRPITGITGDAGIPDIVIARTIDTIADTIRTGGLIVPIRTVIAPTLTTGLFPFTVITGTIIITVAHPTDVITPADGTTTTTDLTTGHAPVFIWV